MKNPKLLAIIILVVSLLVALVVILLHGGKPAARPQVVVSATPTVHPDDALIRRQASDFVTTWGTYTFANFQSSYAAGIRPLVTDEIYQQYFGPQRLPYKLASLERKQYQIKTRATGIRSVTFSGTTAVAIVDVVETVTENDTNRSDVPFYTITYLKQSGRYLVSDIAIEGTDG